MSVNSNSITTEMENNEMSMPAYITLNNLEPVVSSQEYVLFSSPLNSRINSNKLSSFSSDLNVTSVKDFAINTLTSSHNSNLERVLSMNQTSTPLKRQPFSDVINNPIVSQLMRFSRTDPEIKSLLEKSHADETFCLERNQENLLSRRIIKNLVSENKTVGKQAFETTAKFIAANFRGQSEASYFTACVNGNPPTGKLYFAYLNQKKHNQAKLTTVVAPSKSNASDVISEERLDWLRNNVGPLEIARKYWQDTLSLRESLYKEKSLLEYFRDFPVLADSNSGKILINDDYVKKFGDFPSLSDAWSSKKNKLIDILFTDLKNEDDKILKATVEDLNDENQIVPILWLLPAVIPASYVSGKRTADGKKKKPTVLEVRKSLFLHVNQDSDIFQAVIDRRAELLKTKGTLQPTPIFVGGSLQQIENYFVLINETLFTCLSPLEAVQFAFQSYFALNACYPDESKQVWLFIQKYFCNITQTGDKFTVNFANILKKLEC